MVDEARQFVQRWTRAQPGANVSWAMSDPRSLLVRQSTGATPSASGGHLPAGGHRPRAWPATRRVTREARRVRSAGILVATAAAPRYPDWEHLPIRGVPAAVSRWVSASFAFHHQEHPP